ncbi:Hypothetical protein SMAX5B_019356 [Scophthalmus maximus]|nr:Hypothetical protein SMAX5B_019356 [Scophthalmus maximus]
MCSYNGTNREREKLGHGVCGEWDSSMALRAEEVREFRSRQLNHDTTKIVHFKSIRESSWKSVKDIAPEEFQNFSDERNRMNISETL